jgi:proline iminopeptidase
VTNELFIACSHEHEAYVQSLAPSSPSGDHASMRVRIGDVRLYFDVDGCGIAAHGDAMVMRPTLVLLHGGPGADHSVFKPEFAAVTDIAQVVYLDQRGSGRSDRGDPSNWTWRQWADDVAGLCVALDIANTVLIGTSAGGMVAMLCAARHPDLVAGLVLDSTFGARADLEESLSVFERRGGLQARGAARRWLTGDTSPEAAQAWERHGLPLYGSANDGDLAQRRRRALINDEVMTHFRDGGCGPREAAEYVSAITCPTLFLVGLDDPVVPAAAVLDLAASLVNAPVRVETFADVGHGTFRQQPERAFAVLRDFLAGMFADSDSGR